MSAGKKEHYGYYFCQHRCDRFNVAPKKLTCDTADHLDRYSLTDKTAKLFNAYLREKYFKRIAIFQKKREQADVELKKQYELRQALIEKNLSGIYSDEIFKEQNGLIEDKIKSIQFSKNEEIIEKYNLEIITKFVETKLTNLPKTFMDSMGKEDKQPDFGQIKMLLCSIFPSGMPYGRNGYSNTEISPFFRRILDLQVKDVRFGGIDRTRTGDLHSDSVAF